MISHDDLEYMIVAVSMRLRRDEQSADALAKKIGCPISASCPKSQKIDRGRRIRRVLIEIENRRSQ